MKKQIYIAIAILAVFFLIIFFTGALGEFFGKRVEIAALVAIAVVLAAILVRDKLR